MSTTNHYDLIVIGSDLAGLVAASLVARRGKRVLVLPHGPASGSYTLGREQLSLHEAPLIHLSSPPLRRVYEELGLWTQIGREWRLLADKIHWIYDQHRIDLSPAMSNWAQEVQREWPHDPIDAAWDLRRRWAEASNERFDELLASDSALHADGFWARRFLSRLEEQLPPASLDELEPLRDNHPLRRGIRALEPWYLHLVPSQVGKAASMRIAELWAQGPKDRNGGEPDLRKQLLQRIKLKSGDVKPNLRVDEILIKRGKVTGISLLGKRERYGCAQMLLATSLEQLQHDLFAKEQLPKPLTTTLENIRPVAQRFLMHLEVRSRGLSPALQGLVVCVPSAPAPSGIGTMYLRPGPRINKGSSRISITTILDAKDSLKHARETILQALDERGVLPFIHDHLALVHSPHDGREASDGRGRLLEAYGSASALRIEMESIYACKTPPLLGVGVQSHSSGIKNLHFASRLSSPGLGLEGEFSAGWAAAGAIAPASRPGLGKNLFLGRS